jgi:hypothetical protein
VENVNNFIFLYCCYLFMDVLLLFMDVCAPDTSGEF